MTYSSGSVKQVGQVGFGLSHNPFIIIQIFQSIPNLIHLTKSRKICFYFFLENYITKTLSYNTNLAIHI